MVSLAHSWTQGPVVLSLNAMGSEFDLTPAAKQQQMTEAYFDPIYRMNKSQFDDSCLLLRKQALPSSWLDAMGTELHKSSLQNGMQMYLEVASADTGAKLNAVLYFILAVKNSERKGDDSNTRPNAYHCILVINGDKPLYIGFDLLTPDRVIFLKKRFTCVVSTAMWASVRIRDTLAIHGMLLKQRRTNLGRHIAALTCAADDTARHKLELRHTKGLDADQRASLQLCDAYIQSTWPNFSGEITWNQMWCYPGFSDLFNSQMRNMHLCVEPQDPLGAVCKASMAAGKCGG